MEKNTLEFEWVGLKDGDKFAIENTGRGEDVSPEFIISNLSPNVKTLVITLIPKAIPRGKCVSSLRGAMQGIGYGFHRYAGPKPPKGKSHKYCFTIYALDCKLDLKASSTKRKVLNKARNHIIQQGKICGYFE